MRTMIVTGASSGIGRTVAELALERGWTVGLIARRAELLEEVAGGSDRACPLPCDVTDPDAVDAAFAQFAARAGRVDCLFNNAGIFTPPGPIDEIAVDDWQRAVSVNLTGMFLAARAAFAHMRRQEPQGGRIINNGSISAHVPRPGAVTYTTTKHGVTGLTRQLALDGREFGIACGQIDIGNARTDMVAATEERDRAAGRAVQPSMDVHHAAAAVLQMAELPPEANVLFQTIMATTMPYVGRG